jgi:hypothetical protein
VSPADSMTILLDAPSSAIYVQFFVKSNAV